MSVEPLRRFLVEVELCNKPVLTAPLTITKEVQTVFAPDFWNAIHQVEKNIVQGYLTSIKATELK